MDPQNACSIRCGVSHQHEERMTEEDERMEGRTINLSSDSLVVVGLRFDRYTDVMVATDYCRCFLDVCC